MKATEQLIAEHAAITRMLDILEAACARLETGGILARKDFEQMLEFFIVFADRCHHAKEERCLFPALEESGVPRSNGPIGVMLAEHEQGRRYVRQMVKDLEQWDSPASRERFVSSARGYRNLLLMHIQKENGVLFPLADARLTAKVDDAMLRGFSALEEKEIGSGVHEQFHARIDALSDTYLPNRPALHESEHVAE